MEESRIIKIVVERHPDTYVAYPLGVNSAVVGEGDTAEEAFESARTALQEMLDTFGSEILELDQPVMDAFIGETKITLMAENAKVSR